MLQALQVAQTVPADWVGAIANVGFPIVVAMFLLWKLAPLVENLTASIYKIQSSVDRLNDSVNYLSDRTPNQRMGDK